MRLTLVIYSLSSGGAERVMSTMANYWAGRGWHITLLTFDNGTIPPFYSLSSSVHFTPLDIARTSTSIASAAWNNLWRVFRLRQAIKRSRPQAVISFMDTTNVLTVLATRGLRFPVVVAEHNNPALYRIGRAWAWLRGLTYARADRVIVLTERIRAQFPRSLRNKIMVIPNPVVLAPPDSAPSGSLPKPLLMAIGRLTEQKGFDLLFKAFARLKDRYPTWQIIILGEGPLRTELENLRDRLGLMHQVHFLGNVTSVFAALRQADLFVLSSRFEGFPNVLCEAMACGVPVIAADCATGPREIVRDGLDGILVPPEDVDALAAAMDYLLGNEQARKRLASRATEVTGRFGLTQVMGTWDTLLGDLVK